MAEYIEKQAAIEAMKHLPHEYQTKEQRARTGGIAACQMVVSSLPPADVRPVVRGRWIVHMSEMFPADSTIECDQCHEEQSAFISDSFCPNCGADMREVGTEAIKRNTTKIVEKANGIYAEYVRHLQEENKALDEKLASLRNEADAGIEGR